MKVNKAIGWFKTSDKQTGPIRQTRWLLTFFMLICLPWSAAWADDSVDVRVVIDISGSMKETDPQNLRVPALNLVVELLPEGSQAGVWTFGQYVNMLVPLGQVNDQWRSKAREVAGQINSAGQRTNLTEALEKASWKIADDSGLQQSVILLTDGMIDVANGGPQAAANQQSRRRLITDILPLYQKAGAKIHTLALSDAADKQLLEQIALETGGLFLQPANADDLSRNFLRAFERAAPAEQVPLNDNRFSIDSSVREFTALVFRKPGAKPTKLISPSGQEYTRDTQADDVRWHRDVNFDLITISQPEAGEWNLDADIDPENRVQILSDLKMTVDGIEATIFSGDPINADIALTNEDKIITEQALLGLTDFTISVTNPDGRTTTHLISDPEDLPEDGIFSKTLERFTQPGEYRFEVLAQGRTFSRQRTLTANLSEPFEVSTEENVDEQRFMIRVEPLSDLIDRGLSRVLVRTIYPDGSSKIVPMTMVGDYWEFEATPTEGDGDYEYELNIRGVTAGGKTFRSHPQNIDVTFPLNHEAVVVPINTDLSQQAMAGAMNLAAEMEEEAAPEEEIKAVRPPDPPPEPEPVVEPKKPEVPEPAVTEGAEPEEEEGSSLWVWIVIAVVVLLLAGVGAGVFFFLKKKKQAAAAADASDDAPKGEVGLDEVDEKTVAENIQNMDDFEAFMSEGEEQILDAGNTDDVDSPDTIASDTNIDPLADDGAADADIGAGADEDDDWGEFDLDDDQK